jgi:hypothetical protein
MRPSEPRVRGPLDLTLCERRNMKKSLSLIIAVLVLAMAAWVLADLRKKPDLRYAVSGSDSHGELSVLSTPSGATVYIRVKGMKEALRFTDGPFKVNGTYEGTDWKKIGTTPLSRYRLPVSNTVSIEYVYGLLRGTKRKTSVIDCVYDVKIEKEGVGQKLIDSIELTPGNEASFSVDLTTDSHNKPTGGDVQ